MSDKRLFQIAYTPAAFEDAVGHDEFRAVAREASRPPMDELARRPWLTQDSETRGTYLSTHGLRAFGHLELAMVNVPSAFTVAAMKLMNAIGDYIVGGGSLKDGDTMALQGEVSDDLVGFLEMPAGEEDDAPRLLRAVLLT